MKRKMLSVVLAAMMTVQGIVPATAEIEEEYVIEESVDEETYIGISAEEIAEDEETFLDGSEDLILVEDDIIPEEEYGFTEEDSLADVIDEHEGGLLSEEETINSAAIDIPDSISSEESLMETEESETESYDPEKEEIREESSSEEIEQIGNANIEIEEDLSIVEKGRPLVISGTSVIGASAYEFDSSITSLTIGDGVKSIGTYAFAHCSNMTTVMIGNTLKRIDSFAFLWCGKLRSVIIGSGVTNIGNGAFQEDFALKTITFSGDAPAIEYNAFMAVTATAYYPAGNPTWTNSVMQNYGGSITWKPYYGMQQPKLIAAYNGAKGIGIKFYKESNATEYVIFQKFSGKWNQIMTISVNSPELQISENTVMYTDTSVAKLYGKGYIYSVAAKRGNVTTTYDTAGVAIYRLNPPTLLTAINSVAGTATVNWKGVFGKTETNGNYDLQYAVYANGKAGTFMSVTKLPGYNNTTLSATVKGLKKGSTYVFRIRCSKTNKDRGTFYSEYSPWLSVKIIK